jgi:thioredoxin-like negative regulator of GroEL
MRALLTSLALALASTAAPAEKAATTAIHPETSPFDKAANAEEQLQAALAKAATQPDRLVIVVMGANWCHDSRALAGWFETPRFATMLKGRYELVYVDVGIPQMGRGRNLQIPRAYGIKKIKGTPTVMILSSKGKLLNRKDAPSWRDASMRHEDAIYRYFAEFTAP